MFLFVELPKSQGHKVCNVWLLECATKACNKLKEKDLSETDLEHIEKLKGIKPLESRYPLSNAQLRKCGIIFSHEPQDYDKEEEEGENDHGYGVGADWRGEADCCGQSTGRREEESYDREQLSQAEKKVKDLSKKVERLELANTGLTAKNVELSAQVHHLEAEKSTVTLQAVQQFKRSKAFIDQRYRDSKRALVHSYNECKSDVFKDHPNLDMSIHEHKFAREIAAETKRQTEEAEWRKAASSWTLTSPSVSRSLIGDVTIPQYWAHTGLWNWQRYGEEPNDELALESNGDYTRKIGYLRFSQYNNDTENRKPSDNLLNSVWYQPEEIFPVDGQPEIRQHAFLVPVTKQYFSVAQKLEGMELERCVNSSCLPRKPKVTRALSDLASGGSAVSNEADVFGSLAAQNAVAVLLRFITLLH
ncbi:LOW QUALITY PROTEIN: hypothetical protein RJ639_021149 [Escallonia herrerae]|uniref:Uncharacterized protein n=1 Tax=Escallonia herrerae TaxID=1293975 RepID=A0AA88V461_9ASTE|nr:LOW QUALITY PROTEIN: hypothetical protein RJ639_021149 [Escallonia herrerae]